MGMGKIAGQKRIIGLQGEKRDWTSADQREKRERTKSHLYFQRRAIPAESASTRDFFLAADDLLGNHMTLPRLTGDYFGATLDQSDLSNLMDCAISHKTGFGVAVH